MLPSIAFSFEFLTDAFAFHRCSLVAGQIMSKDVIFVRPVEKVGVVYDILRSSNHSNFPVVDTDDNGILFGTIGRNALCILLKQRAFGLPKKGSTKGEGSLIHNYLMLDETDEKYLPLVQWDVIEKAYPKYPSIKDIRISMADRDCYVDLRPYANTAPFSVRETSSVSVSHFLWMNRPYDDTKVLVLSCVFLLLPLQRTYHLFRSLGVRFLPVVNRHNQVVGAICRPDLTPEALASKMIGISKKNV